MKPVSPELLAQNKDMESKLSAVATQYWSMNDIRWMFAYAHYRITQQINVALPKIRLSGPRSFDPFQPAFCFGVSGCRVWDDQCALEEGLRELRRRGSFV
jgi:hypothetical protein